MKRSIVLMMLLCGCICETAFSGTTLKDIFSRISSDNTVGTRLIDYYHSGDGAVIGDNEIIIEFSNIDDIQRYDMFYSGLYDYNLINSTLPSKIRSLISSYGSAIFYSGNVYFLKKDTSPYNGKIKIAFPSMSSILEKEILYLPPGYTFHKQSFSPLQTDNVYFYHSGLVLENNQIFRCTNSVSQFVTIGNALDHDVDITNITVQNLDGSSRSIVAYFPHNSIYPNITDYKLYKTYVYYNKSKWYFIRYYTDLSIIKEISAGTFFLKKRQIMSFYPSANGNTNPFQVLFN